LALPGVDEPLPVRARREAFRFTSVAADAVRRAGEEAVLVLPKDGRCRPVARCLGVCRDMAGGSGTGRVFVDCGGDLLF